MASEFETLSAIAASANGLNPVQRTRYEELKRVGAMGNPQGIESPTGSYLSGGLNVNNDAANAELARNKLLTEQAIGTLQSQQPKIGQIYGQKRDVLQSQINPTKARYDALIAELKGNQQTAEESGQLAVNREMAKRGITQTSGLSDMTMLNTLNPIRRNYSGLMQQTGLAQEADIKAIQDAIALLSSDQLASEMSLAGLISQAQLGGAGNALAASGQLFGNAQSQAQLAQQQAQAQADQNYQNQVLAMQQALQPGQIEAQNLANQLAKINLNNKTSGTGTGTVNIPTISTLQKNIGTGISSGLFGEDKWRALGLGLGQSSSSQGY